jgi:hypothetical protein
MANSGYTVSLSVLVAAGAIVSGYYLSQRQKRFQAQEDAQMEIPLAKVSSVSIDDYCRSRDKAEADYLVVPVRGCPPRAPAEAAPLIEVVVDYRQCAGIGLVPKSNVR